MTAPNAEPNAAAAAAAAAGQLRLTRADALDALADALARAGFRRCEDALPDCDGPGWRGRLTFATAGDTSDRQRVTVVDVVVPEDYPFRSPKVHPAGRVWAEVATGRAFGDEYYEPSRGWHRDAGLALCLFDEADHTRLPWADGAALLEQATAWLAADATGWADDEPALDLDRYLPQAPEERVLLYGPLDGLDGAVLRCQAHRNSVLRLAGRAAQHRSSGRRSGTRRWGPDAVYIAAGGELRGPVRDWEDLRAAVGLDRAAAIDQARRVGLQRVLLTYTRRGVPAALALQLIPGPDNTVQLQVLQSAPTTVPLGPSVPAAPLMHSPRGGSRSSALARSVQPSPTSCTAAASGICTSSTPIGCCQATPPATYSASRRSACRRPVRSPTASRPPDPCTGR